MDYNIGDSIAPYVNSFRQQYKLLYPTILLGVLGSIALGRLAWNDYNLFLSYGPGGPPYNVFGWFFATTMTRVMGIDMFDISKLEKDPDQRTWLGEDWPKGHRSGPRPAVGSHVVPQRQLDQYPCKEIQEVSRY